MLLFQDSGLPNDPDLVSKIFSLLRVGEKRVNVNKFVRLSRSFGRNYENWPFSPKFLSYLFSHPVNLHIPSYFSPQDNSHHGHAASYHPTAEQPPTADFLQPTKPSEKPKILRLGGKRVGRGKYIYLRL